MRSVIIGASLWVGITIEICGNGVDDNCDSSIDEGFLDTDLDGDADCVDTDGGNDYYPVIYYYNSGITTLFL